MAMSKNQSIGSGLCFPNAVKYLVGGPNGTLLVHGLVVHPHYNYRHVHAWCELNGRVIDTSKLNKVEVPKLAYYALGGVTYVKRYSLIDAYCVMDKSEHYGPWDELLDAYQELAQGFHTEGLDWVIVRQSELDRKYKGRLANPILLGL